MGGGAPLRGGRRTRPFAIGPTCLKPNAGHPRPALAALVRPARRPGRQPGWGTPRLQPPPRRCGAPGPGWLGPKSRRASLVRPGAGPSPGPAGTRAPSGRSPEPGLSERHLLGGQAAHSESDFVGCRGRLDCMGDGSPPSAAESPTPAPPSTPGHKLSVGVLVWLVDGSAALSRDEGGRRPRSPWRSPSFSPGLWRELLTTEGPSALFWRASLKGVCGRRGQAHLTALSRGRTSKAGHL